MVKKEGIRTGFGGTLTVVGIILFLWVFFTAREVVGKNYGPGEIFSVLIGLAFMFTIAIFLTMQGARMLR